MVINVDRDLGCVLTTEGEIFKGGDAILHVVFQSIEEARRYAQVATERMAQVVCVVHDHDGTEVEYIGL